MRSNVPPLPFHQILGWPFGYRMVGMMIYKLPHQFSRLLHNNDLSTLREDSAPVAASSEDSD
jgi:hypothetical protein